ncbi:MAG TPA: VWA domain-containing protein [Cellvibrionaceae bacterium]
MADFLAHFHFIRPWVLLALVPLLLAVWLIKRHVNQRTGWRDLIAPHLLAHLLDGDNKKASQSLLIWLAIGWLIATLALAGPAWEERPSPVHRQSDALVIILDLSPSMVAEDVSPSRMVRARLKLADILKRRQEGETALIVYGDDAYVVSPFTSDSNTIAAILPMLSPGIMPLPGSKTEAALTRAVDMLEQSGFTQGQMLLITDGVDQRALPAIDRALNKNRYSLSILGIGSDEGAPIPSGNGGFVRDSNNAVIISRLHSDQLANLARKHNGRYRTSHFDSRDLDALLSDPSSMTASGRDSEQNINQWYDRGPWLVLLLLPLLLYSFRRGVVLALLLVPATVFYSPGSVAQSLDDLWLNRDQQGARALAEGDAATAQQHFKDRQWKATAAYRAGDYQSAATLFGEIDSAQGHYNRGNALAHMGKLDEAIEAYQQALTQEPTLQQAADNKALLEQLKQQQEQEQEQQQSEQDSDDTGEQGGDQSPSGDDAQSNNGDNSEQQPADANNNTQGTGGDNSGTDNPDASRGDYTPEPENIGDEQGQQQPPPSTDPGASEQEEAEQPTEADSSPAEGEGDTRQQASPADAAMTEADREAEQALQRWLRQVPDDPSGLLRNKFRYEYQQKQSERIQQRFDAQDSDQQRW